MAAICSTGGPGRGDIGLLTPTGPLAWDRVPARSQEPLAGGAQFRRARNKGRMLRSMPRPLCSGAVQNQRR